MQATPFPQVEGGSLELDKWYVFPENLPSQRFSGFQNREDATQLRGAFVVGQNVRFGPSGLPSVRYGFEVVGTQPTDTDEVRRAWVYENSNGIQFELKVTGTEIKYWIWGTSTDWATLLTGLTADTEWGFANIGKSSDYLNSCEFSNGTDGIWRFPGALATVDTVTANTITKTGSTTWTQEGFLTATNKVIIGGVEYQYTGGEGTATLTGVTPDPSAGGVVAGNLALSAPGAIAALSTMKGQVMMGFDGRLHMRDETKKSVWGYSKLDDPYDFTASTADAAGGYKMVEGGGAVTAFGKLNKTILCFKKRLIKALGFTTSGTRIDVPQYVTFTGNDEKGTTLGAVNQKSTFSTPLGMVFVTPDNQLVLLTGVTANNEPQYQYLSDPVNPVFAAGDFSDATGICVDGVAFIAFKSEAGLASNDTVLRGDMRRQTIDTNGKILPIRWDAPYVGWYVNDWTAVYNPATFAEELHFHSSTDSATYKVTTDSKTDNRNPFGATLRSWAETFDLPANQKRVSEAFVEIRMTENTNVTATVLYDENGVSGQSETVLDGDSSDNRFKATVYNPIGASSFGSVKLGSQVAAVNPDTYRFSLEVNPNQPFYNVSLQLTSDGEGQDWELVRFGWKLAEVIGKTDRSILT
jgi:hypothetical protein